MTKLMHSLVLSLLLIFFLHVSVVRAETIDPIGDTFGDGAIRHDITSINATFGGSFITFTVNFAGQIFAASANDDRSVVGYIDLDTDRNAATGEEAAINIFGPGPAIDLGDEFFIDLFTEEFQPGRVDIVNALFDVVGTAPITFTTNSFSITVPLTLLGGSNGLLNYGVIAGTFLSPTDRAPNGTLPATSTPIPEPATMLLLGTGLTGIALRIHRRCG